MDYQSLPILKVCRMPYKELKGWWRVVEPFICTGRYIYQRGPQDQLHLPISGRLFILISLALAAALVLPEFVLWNMLSLWNLPEAWIKLASFTLTLGILSLTLNKVGQSFASIGLARKPLGTIIWEIGVGLSAYSVFVVCFIALTTAWGREMAISLKEDVNLLQMTLLLSKAVFVGVTEELIFRGWLLTFVLTRTRHPDLAVTISAGIFALAHINQGLESILFALLFGVLAGIFYLWRKALIAPITVHTLQNFGVWTFQLGITPE